jgi:hypothetical protein
MSQKSQNHDKTKYLRFFILRHAQKQFKNTEHRKIKRSNTNTNHESGDFAKDVGVFSFCQ